MNYNVKKVRRIPKKTICICILAILLICFLGGLALYKETRRIIDATKRYNELIQKYNAISTEYDDMLKNCSVDNIDGIPTELGLLEEEPEYFRDAVEVIFGSNSREKIEKDIDTLQVLIEEAEKWNLIVEQITTPSEDWLINRLQQVEDIKDVQAVTKNNDPDGMLNRNGGYKACVYFTTNLLDPSVVEGKTIVEKGTDAGGAIEVYSTVDDAEARCTYLAGFDGTLLYSGSYAIVGTMVVRTSYMFSGEGQLALTNEIVEALTMIEE